ncbi:DinB family protein [Bacillus benzoevorans]|uniref:DinB-like domain-containing protein n=1 Tax=Bacillus benzoevorans TaxID=1456 RepID=A0A7X0HV41_9BACI|nr:DinB family protein [Bacillus benzoevorans]MBB6446121.1 hypothetical protein [Bacillus benzoevorans]
MSEKRVQEYSASIQHTLTQIVQQCNVLSEETIRWKPSEAEWSILQILSHVKEATPYWIHEAKRVIEKPGSEWGRGLQEPNRLAAVANPDALSVSETIAGVEALIGYVRAELSEFSEEQLHIESPHRNFAKFGNKQVSFIIGHFIDEHVAGHLKQIQRNLDKLAKVN